MLLLVVDFEIFLHCAGQMPFNSIPNTQLLRHITKGLRPEMPSTCGEELYVLFEACFGDSLNLHINVCIWGLIS